MLLHGFAQHPDAWDAVAALLREAGWSVRTLDLMAEACSELGGSPLNSFEAIEAGMSAVCTALAKRLHAIRREAGVPAVLAGYSLGGRLALEAVQRAAAAGDPIRLSALILESANPGPVNGAEREALRQRNHAWAERVRSQGVPQFMDWWASLPLFYSQRALPPDVREKLREGRCGNDEDSLVFQFEAWGQHRQALRADALSFLAHAAQAYPVAFFAGAQDEKYRAVALGMMAAARSVDVRIFPDVGHNVHLEDPAAFVAALLDVLR